MSAGDDAITREHVAQLKETVQRLAADRSDIQELLWLRRCVCACINRTAESWIFYARCGHKRPKKTKKTSMLLSASLDRRSPSLIRQLGCSASSGLLVAPFERGSHNVSHDSHLAPFFPLRAKVVTVPSLLPFETQLAYQHVEQLPTRRYVVFELSALSPSLPGPCGFRCYD